MNDATFPAACMVPTLLVVTEVPRKKDSTKGLEDDTSTSGGASLQIIH